MTDQGGFDIGALMQQAQAMQQQMEEAQQKQAAQVVTGTAGGGKVAIEMTGGGEFRGVKISADAVDPSDVEMLEELVLAALHDATAQVAELQQSTMEAMQLPDMGDLGGLMGG